MSEEIKYCGRTAEEILESWKKEYNVEPDIAQRIDYGFLNGINVDGIETKAIKDILSPEILLECKEDLLNLAKQLYFNTVDALRAVQKQSLENSLIN